MIKKETNRLYPLRRQTYTSYKTVLTNISIPPVFNFRDDVKSVSKADACVNTSPISETLSNQNSSNYSPLKMMLLPKI